MPDFYFKRSAILLIEHEEDSSLGLIINKKTDYKIHELTGDFGQFEAGVYLGGPVQTDNLFILHRRGDLIDESVEVIPGIFWGGDYEQIKEFCNAGLIHHDDIRFYLGYAGWGEHQLERELREKSWLVSMVTKNDVFNKTPEKVWSEAVRRLGHHYMHWLNFPANPQWN